MVLLYTHTHTHACRGKETLRLQTQQAPLAAYTPTPPHPLGSNLSSLCPIDTQLETTTANFSGPLTA